jgi:hypothetical protein
LRGDFGFELVVASSASTLIGLSAILHRLQSTLKRTRVKGNQGRELARHYPIFSSPAALIVSAKGEGGPS